MCEGSKTSQKWQEVELERSCFTSGLFPCPLSSEQLLSWVISRQGKWRAGKKTLKAVRERHSPYHPPGHLSFAGIDKKQGRTGSPKCFELSDNLRAHTNTYLSQASLGREDGILGFSFLLLIYLFFKDPVASRTFIRCIYLTYRLRGWGCRRKWPSGQI